MSSACCNFDGTPIAGLCSASSPPPPLSPALANSTTYCDPQTNPLCESISSSQLTTSIIFSVVCGTLCMLAFMAVRKPLRHIYHKRATQISDLVFRPPPLKLDGLQILWSYLHPVFACTDADLLKTAGLDALMLSRLLALGLQVLLPTSALGCAVRERLPPAACARAACTGAAPACVGRAPGAPTRMLRGVHGTANSSLSMRGGIPRVRCSLCTCPNLLWTPPRQTRGAA